MKCSSIVFLLLIFSTTIQAQVQTVDSLDAKYFGWLNLDQSTNNTMGTSVARVWAELLGNRQAKKTIIVAVIDSGIDINHEDLKRSEERRVGKECRSRWGAEAENIDEIL